MDGLSPERLRQRRELLRRMELAPPRLFDKHHDLAFSLLMSGKTLNALDLSREPQPLREKYGTTLFGQSCLAARRLVEAGRGRQ